MRKVSLSELYLLYDEHVDRCNSYGMEPLSLAEFMEDQGLVRDVPKEEVSKEGKSLPAVVSKNGALGIGVPGESCLDYLVESVNADYGEWGKAVILSLVGRNADPGRKLFHPSRFTLDHRDQL